MIVWIFVVDSAFFIFSGSFSFRSVFIFKYFWEVLGVVFYVDFIRYLDSFFYFLYFSGIFEITVGGGFCVLWNGISFTGLVFKLEYTEKRI